MGMDAGLRRAPDPDRLRELDAEYRARQSAMEARLAQPGEKWLTSAGLGMSLAEARSWIDGWAAYNLLASRHHGYKVE